ncbi:MAG TPA: ABC transporter substrate-binding protein [Acidimicrobiia bacterium]|nr:ABC transporter substrate-binding protein [Acidimicrobiia bacterium]
MRHRARTLAVALAACSLLLACGTAGSATGDGARYDEAYVLRPIADDPAPALPVTVPSADGREVTVTDADRIVPLSGSLAEVVFALGLGDHVVARDVSTTFPEAEHLPLVTHAHDVSAEGVLSVGATVVLAQPDTGPPEALDQIRAAGVPVVVFDLPTQLEDVSTRIHAIAAALGVPTEGAALAERTQAAIADAQRAIPHDEPPPRVAFLYMRGTAGVYLIAGDGSGADSMIEAAGAIDAGTAMGLDKPFTPITSEALVEAAPDVILMTTTGLESVGGIDGLLQIPGIAQTPAGRERRVITQEDGVLYSFGARTPAALATLIGEIHGRAG